MKQFLWLVVVLGAVAGNVWLGQSVWSAPADSANFVWNLPVIMLDPKEPIVSEKKVPCTVRMVLPNHSDAGKALTGIVRIHGASSQGYPKKSLGITLDAPVRCWECARARIGC